VKIKTVMPSVASLMCFTLLLSALAKEPVAFAQDDLPSIEDCPPIVFVKRPHFDRPFGIGTIIGWDIYKPGGGIYLYDPKRPERGAQEIWRRDEGVIFDMSLSFDAQKLLFAWRKCSTRGNVKGPLTVSRVNPSDTLDHVLEPSDPISSAAKPNHSFWDRRGGLEWAEVRFEKARTISEIAVYWFDDQPQGGCAVPKSWRLFRWQDNQWQPVRSAAPLGCVRDSYNTVRFAPVETRGLRIELRCQPQKSAGVQRLRIGTDVQHRAILAEPEACVQGRDIDCFHIYEINVDGTGLRQLTRGPFQDIHPFYLPDGQIGMVSTRVKGYTMCQPGAACALYVMNPDGANMQRIHFGTLADHSPYVLDSGAVLFTRWEYQDKDLTYLQGLWTINPDGTYIQLFYGNTILEPAVIWQAKPIPGSSKLLCTLAPHHGNPVGAVGIIDRSHGLENPQAIRNLTPEIDYNPQRNARGPGDRQYAWAYRDPYPIQDDLFVVAHGAADVERYQLYLMNDQGHKRLLYGDAKLSCFNPLPLLAREHVHTRPSMPESPEPSGAFFVSDVYQGLMGVERGAVKALRVMTVPPKPCNMRGQRAYDMDPIMGRGTYYAKICLGTVPVSANGSAYFRAPAGIELYFQALDSSGKELCRMGSITQLVPGETQSCIGCHEPRFMAPPSNASADPILQGKPDEIQPPAWGAGPVDFVRQVQPVFNRYCVDCHQGINPDCGIDLSDDKTRFFNMAYDHLTEKRLVHFQWLLNEALVRSFRPLESGARVSKLVKLIEAQHADVNMDLESRQRIYTWIEANVPYYGTYEHTRPGTPGSRDACSDPWFKSVEQAYNRRCANCHGKGFYTSNEPRHHTWINLTHPERSRLLHAPLARAAGGQGLCQSKDGKAVSVFSAADDRGRQALLRAIRQGSRALYAHARMDMDGAQAVPYLADHAGPYDSFAGP